MPLAPAPWLLAAFLALTGVAWIVADPPGAPPDESQHYVKALGAGAGDLYGKSSAGGRAELRSFFRLSASERRQLYAQLVGQRGTQPRWQARTSRKFSVPAGLGFTAFGCTYNRPTWSARCLRRGKRSRREADVNTYTGTYQPYVYVVPGLLMRLTRNPFTAMRLGRLGMAALSLGLLGIAAFVLWDRARGAVSLVGLFAVLTPTAVYLSATLNPSGPEIAASICFAATLLRLTRGHDWEGWVWAALAVSGLVLAVSRSLGPAFLCVIAVSITLVMGPRRMLRVIRGSPRHALSAGVAIALGVVAGLAWELAAQPHPGGSIGALARELGPSLSNLGTVARQAVGMFGKFEISLPGWAFAAWGVLIAAVLFMAVAGAAGRVQASLGLVALLVAVAVIVVSLVYSRTGFQLQGRYVLPVLVILPLTAGELLYRRRRRLHEAAVKWLLLGAAAVAAAGHFAGWWITARRYAVGTDGPLFFIPHAEWTPPGGWELWTLAAVAGAICCLLSGVAAARSIGASAATASPGSERRPNGRRLVAAELEHRL
jgi:Predicted membrane protein (DUF2142)